MQPDRSKASQTKHVFHLHERTFPMRSMETEIAGQTLFARAYAQRMLLDFFVEDLEKAMLKF